MARKIQVKRGNQSDLPTLAVGELGFTVDENRTYIGSQSGNVELANKSEVASQLAEKVQYFDNVTGMKSKNLKVGALVRTAGYYTPNDGGGASYRIITSSDPVDNGSLVLLDNGLKAQLVEESYTGVKQFGARGDGTTDDSDAFINNLAWGGRYGHKAKVTQGIYRIAKRIIINDRHLEGDGWHRTYLHIDGAGQLYVEGTGTTIEKMTLAPSALLGSTRAENAIELFQTSHNKLSDIIIHGFNIGLKINDNCWSNTFSKLNLYGNDICIFANGEEINNTNFYDCHAHDSRIGFKMLSGEDGFHYKINFFSCQIELNTDTGAYIEANGSYSFFGTFFERNNLSNQSGYDKGGICITYPNQFGPRPSTVDLNGCYHLMSGVKLKLSGSTTTTLTSNFFKDLQQPGQYAVEVQNPGSYAGQITSKVLNINAAYESVPNKTNAPEHVYELNAGSLVGLSTQRPNNPTSGQMYFDFTLGKAIWFNGYSWVDATGTVV